MHLIWRMGPRSARLLEGEIVLHPKTMCEACKPALKLVCIPQLAPVLTKGQPQLGQLLLVWPEPVPCNAAGTQSSKGQAMHPTCCSDVWPESGSCIILEVQASHLALVLVKGKLQLAQLLLLAPQLVA